MGIGYRMSPGDYTPPNPNPERFKIISRENYGRFSILLVEYKDCSTFDGMKLLLTKDLPKNPTVLDPHLLEGGPVFARFKPNQAGEILARQVVTELANLVS